MEKIRFTFPLRAVLTVLCMLAVPLAAEELIMDEVASDEIIMEEVAPPQEPVDSNAIAQMPEQVSFVDATYPRRVYSRGIEGAVLLELLVNESGRVDSAAVVDSLHPVLDSTARHAALQFRFEPAVTVGGDTVPVFIQYEYRFSLDEVVADTKEYTNYTGQLREMGTRQPLAEANVVLSFQETPGIDVPLKTYLTRIGSFEGQEYDAGVLYTVSDSQGNFSFSSLPEGSFQMKVVKSGYEAYKTQEEIDSATALDGRYYIRKLSYNDYEVTAYYNKEKKAVSRRNISVNEVKKVPGLGGDAVKVVQAMPGVARASFGSGELAVRGGEFWDSGYFLDGVPIAQLYHFGGVKSVVNSNALDDVVFYPGGWGVQQGGAIAGLVDIQTRKPLRERLTGHVDISTLDASFFLEGPVNEKLSFMATARRSYFGEIVKLVLENTDDGPNVSITPYYWDYLLRMDYDMNEKHHAYMTVNGSFDSLQLHFKDDDFEQGSEDVGAVDQIQNKTYFSRGLLGLESSLSDVLTNDLKVGTLFQTQYFSIFGEFLIDLDWWSFTLRDNLALDLSDKITVNGGVDMQLNDLDMSLEILSFYGADKDTIQDKYGMIGVYANCEIRPNDRLLIIPGLRYDYYRELIHEGSLLPEFADYDFDNTVDISGDPSLRISTRYQLKEDHTLKAAVGNYNQTPKPDGQAIHPDWGNPHLPTTKAAHYVAGWEWGLTDLIFMDLQGFYNTQWDIPRLQDNSEITNEQGAGDLFVADKEGRTFGMELMLRHNQGERFFGWLAYTLSRSERWDNIKEEYVLFDKDQTHNFQILGSWRLKKNWEVGGRVVYVTGNPDSPRYVSGEYINGKSINIATGPENSIRQDPFFRVDARVEKKYVTKRLMVTAYLDF
ncbi:MAG: TonB-dependent receptor domain-containing protein, partial [Fibrobacterota bacterium]